MPQFAYGTYGDYFVFYSLQKHRLSQTRSQNRQAIQVLDEARDAIQCLWVGSTYIMSGSVDGHIRTYDLRKGELRADYLGRMTFDRASNKIPD